MAKFSDIRNIRVLAFLDAYERQECLWNPLLDSYKNKADRDGAYLEIVRELGLPTLTAMDVKLKIKSIRTTYAKELRLFHKHKQLGKAYKPTLFWFNKANSFLKNVCVSGHKKSSIVKEENSIAQSEYTDCTFEYVSDGGSEENVVENETHENETHEDANNTLENQIDFKTFMEVVAQPEIPAQTEPENTHSEASCSEYSTRETPMSRNKNKTPPVVGSTCKEDEFDMFCRSVAAQLRSVPDAYSRSVAKLKIQQILFEAETGHYKSAPCITIPIVEQVKTL